MLSTVTDTMTGK